MTKFSTYCFVLLIRFKSNVEFYSSSSHASLRALSLRLLEANSSLSAIVSQNQTSSNLQASSSKAISLAMLVTRRPLLTQADRHRTEICLFTEIY